MEYSFLDMTCGSLVCVYVCVCVCVCVFVCVCVCVYEHECMRVHNILM